MCINEPCNNYTPDLDQAEREGQGCVGMGWTPDCIYCNQNENAHWLALPIEERYKSLGLTDKEIKDILR